LTSGHSDWADRLSVRVAGCQKLQTMYGLTLSGIGCFIAVRIIWHSGHQRVKE